MTPETVRSWVETPEEFRAWLLSRPVGAEVGLTCEQCRCPLANYLRERMKETGAESVWVHVTAGLIVCHIHQDGNPSLPLLAQVEIPDPPAWASLFVERIDGVDEVSRVVKRERALRCLTGATPSNVEGE